MPRRRLIPAFVVAAILSVTAACSDMNAPSNDPTTRPNSSVPCTEPAPEVGMVCGYGDVWSWN